MNPMTCKTLTLLLTLALAGLIFTPVIANPFYIEVPPPDSVNLIIETSYSTEHVANAPATIYLCFTVTVDVPDSISMQQLVSKYSGDWMNQTKYLVNPVDTENVPQSLVFKLNLTGVTPGEHTLNFTGHGQGYYTNGSDLPEYIFIYEKMVSVNFSIGSNYVYDISTVELATVPEFSSIHVVVLILFALTTLVLAITILKKRKISFVAQRKVD
jgi:hypothetical protein